MKAKVRAMLFVSTLAFAAMAFVPYVETGINLDILPILVGFVLLVVGLLTSNHYRLRVPLDRRLSS